MEGEKIDMNKASWGRLLGWSKAIFGLYAALVLFRFAILTITNVLTAFGQATTEMTEAVWGNLAGLRHGSWELPAAWLITALVSLYFLAWAIQYAYEMFSKHRQVERIMKCENWALHGYLGSINASQSSSQRGQLVLALEHYEGRAKQAVEILRQLEAHS